jgi:hypothetical protein
LIPDLLNQCIQTIGFSLVQTLIDST